MSAPLKLYTILSMNVDTLAQVEILLRNIGKMSPEDFADEQVELVEACHIYADNIDSMVCEAYERGEVSRDALGSSND